MRRQRSELSPSPLWHGPLLLVQETTGGTVEGLVVPVPDESGRLVLPKIDTPPSEFVVPAAHCRVTGLGNAKPGKLESLALNRAPGRLAQAALRAGPEDESAA